MTVHFPDVSNWQAGLSLHAAPAVVAKATEGTWYRDPTYLEFKQQAATLRIPFCAYHWLHRGDPVGEARYAYAVVGPGVPLMVDDEEPSTVLDLATTLAFVAEYRRLGGTVTLEYLPRWYWQRSGAPDLTPLARAGLSLVSSHYTSYSDTGPGWDPYGGVTPTIWQYSSTQPFNGQAVDFNAFKGTVAELAALFAGKPTNGGDMLFLVNAAGDPGIWLSDGLKRRPLYPQAQAQLYLDHGAIRLADVDLSWFGDPVGPAPTALGGTAGPVDLTDAAVAKVADAVVDEAHARLAG